MKLGCRWCTDNFDRNPIGQIGRKSVGQIGRMAECNRSEVNWPNTHLGRISDDSMWHNGNLTYLVFVQIGYAALYAFSQTDFGKMTFVQKI